MSNSSNVYSVKLSQINLGRRIEAMSNLAQNNSQGHFLSLIQEPHLLKKQGRAIPSGLDNQHQIYCAADTEPRAAIYAHKEVPIWINHDLSDRDNATCLWITKELGLSRVLVVSSYWDHFILGAPAKLTKAVEYAKSNNFDILIGADSNSHSVLTGSHETNARGKLLEEFILKHNLDILNRGSQATFSSHVGSSCIDVTLASPNLAAKIRNWRLSRDDSYSDHKTILFNLETIAPEIELKRDFNKLDINLFKKLPIP